MILMVYFVHLTCLFRRLLQNFWPFYSELVFAWVFSSLARPLPYERTHFWLGW